MNAIIHNHLWIVYSDHTVPTVFDNEKDAMEASEIRRKDMFGDYAGTKIWMARLQKMTNPEGNYSWVWDGTEVTYLE